MTHNLNIERHLHTWQILSHSFEILEDFFVEPKTNTRGKGATRSELTEAPNS